MKILLTGHEGYVGSSLRALLAARHEVIGWGRGDDVLRIDATLVRDRGIDAVVNCATVMDRSEGSLTIDDDTDRVNMMGMRAIVRAIRGTAIRLIQISTKDVFGPVYGPGDVTEEAERYVPRFRVSERQPFDPRTPYAKSKLIAELIAESHPYATVIRLSSCYTEDDHRRGSWVLNMAKSMLRGATVTIAGNGKQFRDLLHVADLAALIERVLGSDAGRVGRIALHAGGGEANTWSILEFVRAFEPDARIAWAPPSDRGFAFDNSLAEQLLGWRPTIVFRDRLPALRNTLLTLGYGPTS